MSCCVVYGKLWLNFLFAFNRSRNNSGVYFKNRPKTTRIVTKHALTFVSHFSLASLRIRASSRCRCSRADFDFVARSISLNL